MGFELNGKVYETDEEGYLMNLAEWDEEAAKYIAGQENVEMTENHWEVVNFLREYYNDYQIAPAVRVLTKAIGKKLGAEKGNSKYLYELFPMARPSRPARSPACPSPPAVSKSPSGDDSANGFGPLLKRRRTTIHDAADNLFAHPVLRRDAWCSWLGWATSSTFTPARPAPLKIPTTPAPVTAAGVGWRMAREVVFFESLFKSNKWTWIFGWLFHFALLLVVLRHLRYFTEPVWSIVVLIQPFGTYAGFAMIAALAGLWARRWLVDRVRYISTPSDHLMLALLLAIGLTGLGMRFVAHTDIVAVKAFILGLMRFDWQPLPSDPVLLVHLALVASADDHFPDQQAAACARPVLQPDAQPGRQPARSPPYRGLGKPRWTKTQRHTPWPPPPFETPKLKSYPVIPLVQVGAMAHSKPFVAAAPIQKALGFPGELVEDWQDKAIAKMGELLGKYRSLQVYMDACVHCGACSDKCHYFLGTGDPKNMPVARQDLMRKVYRRYFTFAGKFFPKLVGAVDFTKKCWTTGTAISTSVPNAVAVRCFAPTASTPPKSPWPPARSWIPSAMGQKYSNEIIGKVHRIGNNLGLPGPALENTLQGLEEDTKEETGVDVKFPLNVKGAEVLLITPSADFFAEPHIESLIGYAKVFHAAGISWTLSSMPRKPATFGMFIGNYEQLRKIALRIREAALELGVKRIVVGECGHAWRVAYSFWNTLTGVGAV